jgi:hypothetical protein
MATLETIQIAGELQAGFNVSAPVGALGTNAFGDVMLVQAMFKYIVAVFPPETLGVDSANDVSVPTGNFDTKTRHLIEVFQRKNAHSLLRVDGLIHPAAYENRNVRVALGKDRMMTITLLHLGCMAVSPGGAGYTADMRRRFPQLLPWIRVVK